MPILCSADFAQPYKTVCTIVLVKHFGFFADPKVPFRTFAAGIFSLTQPESCKSQNAAIFFSEFISSTARGKVLWCFFQGRPSNKKEIQKKKGMVVSHCSIRSTHDFFTERLLFVCLCMENELKAKMLQFLRFSLLRIFYLSETEAGKISFACLQKEMLCGFKRV